MSGTLKGYVVMLHHQVVGTFAPSFRTLDEAEEFSNAMRLITVDVAVSEPVPVIASKGVILEEEADLNDTSNYNWDQALNQRIKLLNCLPDEPA